MSTPEEIFWDEFAVEYAEIQAESQVPIAEDLVAYLLEDNLLPIETIVDFAAGSGKYIPAFYPFVDHYLAIDFSREMLKIILAQTPDRQGKIILSHKDQQAFLADPEIYPCIFMAMNPALLDWPSLLRFYQKTACLLILRVVDESEDLFQPWEKREEAVQDLHLVQTYKRWLDQAHIAWKSHQFEYSYMEEVDQETFRAYFCDDYPASELADICKNTFGQKMTAKSTTRIVFELLIIPNNGSSDYSRT